MSRSSERRAAVSGSPRASPTFDHAAKGALVGTFVGDALGMPFEGMPATAIPPRVEMRDARLGRGTYTDDTEMMIALAESLLRCDVVDEEDVARSFSAAYDPKRGYGAGTRRVFELWQRGVPVREAAGQLFGGQGSLGNGAAMRIAPVAVRFADDPVLLDVQARRSARVTHAHAVGVDAAAVQAATIAAAALDEPLLETARQAARTEELRSRLDQVAELRSRAAEPEEVYAELGTSSNAQESVPAAIYAALQGTDFASAVIFAVRCGGDTDTVAAMSGAIAGARFGHGAIPRGWLDALEDDDRGRRHVEALAERLSARTSAAAVGPAALRDHGRA